MKSILIAPNTHAIEWSKEEQASFRQPVAPINRKDYTERNRARLLLPVASSFDDPDYKDHDYPECLPASLDRGTSHNRRA